MPCNSDGMEPTAYESKIKRTVKLLCYVYRWVDITVSLELCQAANEQFYFTKSEGDKWTSELCKVLTDMTDADRDQLVYNNRVKLSRQLADWWEDHLEVDAKRIAKEQQIIEKTKLIESGLSKLTEKEKVALKLI